MKCYRTFSGRLSVWMIWCGLLALVCFPYCDPQKTTTKEPEPINPADYGYSALCPGAKGCMKPEGELFAGAAAVALTPEAYEFARFSYMVEKSFCPTPTPMSPFGLLRCGELEGRAQYGRRDCGRDGLCPQDNLPTRKTCDENTPCPTPLVCNVAEKKCYLKYTGPDADGSEGDGLDDWFVDCGRDRICPCLDPEEQPSYYGKDKKCLIGHKPNPAYKGPDADGSEGNGIFEGVWMAGFGGNHPAQGKYDDIWARALVLRTGDTTVAIVSLDLVGFFNNKIQEIRKQVAAQLPEGEIDYILVSSTHAHEGPDSVGQWGRSQSGIPLETGATPAFLKRVVDGATRAIVEAHKQLQKAKLKVGHIKTGRQGFLRDSRDPQIFDDNLHVLHLTSAEKNETISVLVNWGNHPEVLSDINNYITSDFPHFLREALEKGVPKSSKGFEIPAYGGTAIYLQATVGGLMTPLGIGIPDLDGVEQTKSDWEKSKALGHQLAVKAVEALKNGEEISKVDLAVWAKTTKVKVENKAFQALFWIGTIFDRPVTDYDPKSPINESNMPKITTEIAVIRLGKDITFFSMPGELDPEITVGGYDGSWTYGADLIDPKNPNPPDLTKAPKGPYLRERIPGKYKFFVGLGNDFLGYLIASWNYQLDKTSPFFTQAPGDHYEETNGLGPSIVPTLMKLYDELIPQLEKPGPPAK
ncbi:neutral/alkaline non-lysosomal ceramidase N-terminal domain-containing protein [Myxococcota bacterium]|nr:neutral/alkaline non-lysosomal ceramidase N-terminal domain-containing protein [Myxococcota bacterium]